MNGLMVQSSGVVSSPNVALPRVALRSASPRTAPLTLGFGIKPLQGFPHPPKIQSDYRWN